MGRTEHEQPFSLWPLLNRRFWDNYFDFNELRGKDREHVFLHDLRNLFTKLQLGAHFASVSVNGLGLNGKFPVDSRLQKITNLTLKNLSGVGNFIAKIDLEALLHSEEIKQAPEQTIKFIRRSSLLKKFFPVLIDAVRSHLIL